MQKYDIMNGLNYVKLNNIYIIEHDIVLYNNILYYIIGYDVV